jgi:hypothetical protein
MNASFPNPNMNFAPISESAFDKFFSGTVDTLGILLSVCASLFRMFAEYDAAAPNGISAASFARLNVNFKPTTESALDMLINEVLETLGILFSVLPKRTSCSEAVIAPPTKNLIAPNFNNLNEKPRPSSPIAFESELRPALLAMGTLLIAFTMVSMLLVAEMSVWESFIMSFADTIEIANGTESKASFVTPHISFPDMSPIACPNASIGLRFGAFIFKRFDETEAINAADFDANAIGNRRRPSLTTPLINVLDIRPIAIPNAIIGANAGALTCNSLAEVVAINDADLLAKTRGA